MALNQRARRVGSFHMHLLRESARILRLWTYRAGLVRKGA